jgi:hypothetical protein
VIIAGDYRAYKYPVDGSYAVRSDASSPGGLAVGPDGSVYFPISLRDEGRIAHVTADGRMHILPFNTIAKQIDVKNGSLWLMSSYSDGFSLTKGSLANSHETLYVGWRSQAGNNLSAVSWSGKLLPKQQQADLNAFWANSVFGLRADGVPIIASNRAQLFEALGHGKLRQWEPNGYTAAVRKVSSLNGFKPLVINQDNAGGIVVLGREGLIRVPSTGAAKGIRFPANASRLPPWTAVTPLEDHSLLLLGGVSATHNTPRPTKVLSDGTLQPLSWGGPQKCDEFNGTLAAVSSSQPGGVSRRPDGVIVLSDMKCDRVYAFRLPETR